MLKKRADGVSGGKRAKRDGRRESKAQRASRTVRRRKEPEEKQDGQRATDGERAKLRGRDGRCDGEKSRKKSRKVRG